MRKLLFLAAVLLFFAACDRNMVYHEFRHMDKGIWTWENPAEFEFAIEDTVSMYDILIQMRHSVDYPLSNLYMFVNIEGPQGQILRDTINFLLAKPDGEWVGKGVGKTRELGYLYRKNTLFRMSGEYKIKIEQAMRASELPVEDLGLRVEKVNQ